MTISVGASGFQRSSLANLVTQFQNDFILASGNSSLDFSSNTPLGNFVNILAQQQYDQETYAQSIYNLILSINNSTGVNLDNLGVFFNVARKAGTYTLQYVNIVANDTVFLAGLNETQAPFTVSDGNGNNFFLVSSITVNAGTTSLLFQAENIGAVQVTTNTLTTIITIINGIVSCNNPNPPVSVGSSYETDAQYRIRLIQSKSISAIGYLDSLLAKLLAITNLTSAIVLENYNNIIDANGIPPHSIWVITEGGSDTDIANAIYNTKSFGCGMKGSIVVNVARIDGQTAEIKFDRATLVNLYIQLNLKNNGSGMINITTVQQAFANAISFNINEPADSGTLTCTLVSVLSTLGINASVSNLQISSDNTTWVNYLNTPLVSNIWSVISTNITINLI